MTHQILRRAAAATVLMLMAGCAVEDGIPVSRADGGAWPFTIDSGRLRCDTDGPRKYVTLDTGKGIYYALNGSARTFGYPDSTAILKPGMVGNDLQPFIARGLTLCK